MYDEDREARVRGVTVWREEELGGGISTSIESARQLLHDISTLPLEVPHRIEFELEYGPALGIVVGSDETVLTYQASTRPPYYVSMGDPARDGLFHYRWTGQLDETFASNLVPMAEGLQAAREFLSTGALPTSIRWERL